MQSTPKATNILGHFVALLGAVVMLAIATWVSASSSQQVQPLDNLAVPRTGHTATALSDGRILITGGRDAAGNLVAASEIFDPETQTSSTSASLNTARVDHSATVLADGRVLVAGGTGDSGALSSAEIFDSANAEAGFQVIASPMTSARTGHTATLLNNGSVLIAGGETGGTAEIFDATTQTFSPTLWNLIVARSGHTATLFADDSVLLAGGNTVSMEMYTPLDQKFTLDQATLSVVRTGHWAFELSDTRLLLFQGDTGNSIDEFDPTTDTLTPKGSLDFHASSSTLLANGKVLVLGTDVSGLYNPDAVPPAPDFTAFDETSVPNSGILPRSGQSAVTLPGDKKILIAGGVDGNNQLLGHALFNPAKIWTDKDDYQPDEPVILSGSGWIGNEAVYLYAVDNETEQWTYEMTVNADANGEFVLSPYFIVELRHQGVQFHVTALGAQSTMQADVYFTDAQPGSVSLTPSSVTVNPGNTATYTAAVTQNGNSNPCTLTFSLTYTGTPPVGTTPTFVPNPVTMTTSNVSSTLNITTTNTGPPAGRTQPGTYNFTVTVTKGANCQGGAGTVTTTGTLVVAAPSPTPTATATATPTFTPTATATATFTPTPTPTATAAATNLTVTAASGTYGGTVTLSATLTSGASGVSGKTINFTLNGNPAGTGVTNGSGVATSNTAVTLCGATYNAGTYPTGAAASFAGDLSFVTSSGSNSLTVSKANATVVVTPYTVTYDGASHTATYTITGVCNETPAQIGGTVDVTGTSHVNAGTYNDTWSFTGSANYDAIVATPIINTINKADATWTTNPNSKTYGDSEPNPLTTGSGSGFTAVDAPLMTASYSRMAGENTSPPTYHITATLGPAYITANYNITNNGAEFTINKRAATWTTNPANKTYGDADPVPLTTGSGSNFVAGDNVTATYSRVAGENASPPTYHMTATLSATPMSALDNYVITNDGAEFTINKRVATWTTNNNSKTYGDADPAPLTSGSGSNFVLADNVTATYTRAAGENASPPTYHITATLSATPMSALDNYIITNDGAEFAINKRVATWTTNANSKTYGDTDPAPLTTGGGTNFVAGDNVTATYTRVAGENASPPTYHITATLSATPMSALDNYIITNDGAEFTINKRLATWTTNPNSKTYGDADPVPLTSGSGSNFVPADNVTATYTRAAGDNASPPTYHISAMLSATPMSALDNYIITNDGAEFTINKRLATWTTNPNSKTYGDLDPVSLTTGGGTNFVAGDNVTATYSRVAGETASPPTYHITATLSATPISVLDNYIITNDGAEFTINKRLATWTTNNNSKIYGDLDPVPLTTGGGSNFVAGDNVSATYSRVAGENASPPTYHITATLSATPMSALDNYIITNNGAEFTINPAVLTITADHKTKIYGQSDPALTYVAIGFQFSDTAATVLTGGLARVAGENVGSYAINQGTLAANANYTIAFTGHDLVITPATLTIMADHKTKIYSQSDPALTYVATGFQFTDTAATVLTGALARVVGENVGSYAINQGTLAANANYTIVFTGHDLVITPATLTITATNRTKVYGATYTPDTTPPSVDFTVSGLVFSDTVTSIALSSPGYVNTATVAGSPYTVTPSGAVGTGLGNYTISYTPGSLTVNPATLTINATNRTKVFGATYTPDTTPPSVDYSVSGLLFSDSVTSITLTCAGYPSSALPTPSGYTITPSAAMGSGLGNYTISYGTGTLTITYGTCSGGDPSGVILPPINSDGSSVYKRKGGSTIPVKFKVCDANGNSISDPYAVFLNYPQGGQLTMTGSMRGTIDNINESGETVVPDVAFEFTGGQWHFNMATTNLTAGNTYTFRINLAFGPGITFTVGVK